MDRFSRLLMCSYGSFSAKITISVSQSSLSWCRHSWSLNKLFSISSWRGWWWWRISSTGLLERVSSHFASEKYQNLGWQLFFSSSSSFFSNTKRLTSPKDTFYFEEWGFLLSSLTQNIIILGSNFLDRRYSILLIHQLDICCSNFQGGTVTKS